MGAYRKLAIFHVALVLAAAVLPLTPVQAEALPGQLIISEIKPTNDTTAGGFNEFIELYNQSNADINLAEYKLAYFNVASPTTQIPVLQSLGTSLLESHKYVVLARTPSQINDSISLSSVSSLKDDEGTVRLMGPDSQTPAANIYDQVSWLRSSVSKPLSGEINELPATTKSLQRISRSNIGPVSLDQYWVASDSTPFSYTYIAPDPLPLPDPEPTVPPPQVTCEGIFLNEILPNPEGSDSGHEFIELYNPTNEAVSLDGCSIQTNANTKVYALPAISIEPGGYYAVYDIESGLTLANNAGGTVWLLSSSAELQEISYPGELDENVSWARFGDIWQATYILTPNLENNLQLTKPCDVGEERSIQTGQCQIPPKSIVNELQPCAVNQERNPETNRCRLLQSSTLASCKAGEIRNPDTNRCRSILDNSSVITPCKVSQERNPETNRCRNIVSAASVLTPCDEGQERNPETNRCRKATQAGAIAGAANVKDVASSSLDSSPKWWLAGVSIAGAVSYGVYEWRREAMGWISRIKFKLPGVQ